MEDWQLFAPSRVLSGVALRPRLGLVFACCLHHAQQPATERKHINNYIIILHTSIESAFINIPQSSQNLIPQFLALSENDNEVEVVVKSVVYWA